MVVERVSYRGSGLVHRSFFAILDERKSDKLLANLSSIDGSSTGRYWL
jgi:hypothetical protein